jgi:uncharacterized protein with PIN domain
VTAERQDEHHATDQVSPVRCPGCGREYDAGLFAFGRTLHCTCGTRVGLAPSTPDPDPGVDPRFFADAMLGRLARWLRILGYDTRYEAHVDDADLVRRALEEERVILTRDRGLPEEFRVPALVLVEAERPAEQLRELVQRLRLDPEGRLFTRCSRCNASLESAARDHIADRVPARVLHDHQHFKCCPSCGRVYWEGSHVDRIRNAIRHALHS